MRYRLVSQPVSGIVAVAAGILLGITLSAAAQKKPQVEANHMRWNNHDAVLSQSIAWQDTRGGHWVTVVMLTDRPVPRDSIVAGTTPASLMEAAGAQGVAFAVMSGGVPPPEFGFDVAYRAGGSVGTSTATGTGGFEIESQSATAIKGRVVYQPFVVGERDERAWSVSFDAPVVRGDAKRMAAEGAALGVGGGQPGADLLALQQAKFGMNYAALSALASTELADFLKDPATRDKNLKMLKSMTSQQARVAGGLRTGDTARVYWVQQWPAALDNRCVDTLVLKDGKWRSTASACQSE